MQVIVSFESSRLLGSNFWQVSERSVVQWSKYSGGTTDKRMSQTNDGQGVNNPNPRLRELLEDSQNLISNIYADSGPLMLFSFFLQPNFE